jgi:hypothetical protein
MGSHCNQQRKRTFLGVYHKMSSDNLQNYLNEFVYNLNRRNFADLSERVIIAAVFPYWYESTLSKILTFTSNLTKSKK